MKIKENCLLREIGGSYVVVVTGAEAVDFRGMITLQNDTAVFLFKTFEEECSIEAAAEKLVEKYDITKEHAIKSTAEFIDKLREVGIIEE